MLSLKPPTSPEIGTPQTALPSQSELTQEITPKQNLPGLVAMIREHFERAKSVKAQFVNDRLLSCVYAFKSEYEPKKLAAIKELGGSEAYIPLTNMKVRAGKAWLSDIFFSPNSKIFELKTTPVPTPPPDIAKRIQGELSQEIDRLMEAASRLAVMSKGMFDMSSIQDVIESRKAAIREKYIKKVRERAKSLIEVEEQRIHDQFVEGGFYKALAELLNDIMTYPTAILKGPVLRKKRKFITNSREIVDVVVPTYNRVSPFDAFPAPYASNFEDGYFIEILHLRPQDLRSLVGMEGYYSDAILEVLEQYNEGGLTEWTGLVHERNYIEDKTEIYDDTIDVIEYWGAVRGALLEEWDIEVEDRSEYYDIVAWVVDNKIIKAILNPDPLGTKPYNKASFVEIPDSFWGMSLPEILSPIQNSVNALARAAINNAVLSSGALIERNVDRIGSKAKKEIIPFQIFDVRESALNSAPAYRFYQLTPTADRLVVVMSMFQKMADEYSGIPAYAHGDVTVGGAGRTASGLSMLQNQASRGIKDVVKNIDEGIIEPLVSKQYYFNLYSRITDPSQIPDLTIQAKGSEGLREKEAQSARMLEYLQITSNPVDMQLMGMEGRKYLLEGIAKNAGLDSEKLFPQDEAQAQELAALLQGLNPVTGEGGQIRQISPNNTAGVPQKAAELGLNVNQFKKENGR